ncbi:hypothetical protein ACFSL6_10250 [Paenibacillus thailandensis]|uniref:Uncharacterized protein n=1 Tax=Paenibacillus thailandensis TaxID=393250 RepID=A0ABW5QVJ5_9BACL
MGTRLWLEEAVKERFPQLRYVRVRTSGRHRAVIYAWDGDLRLTDKDAAALRRYAIGGFSHYICFSVEPYDRVPAEGGTNPDVPEPLKAAALRPELNQDDIFAMLGSLFPGIGVAFNRYDEITGTVYIHVYGHGVITPDDKRKLERYAEELIPVGSTAKLIFFE